WRGKGGECMACVTPEPEGVAEETAESCTKRRRGESEGGGRAPGGEARDVGRQRPTACYMVLKPGSKESQFLLRAQRGDIMMAAWLNEGRGIWLSPAKQTMRIRPNPIFSASKLVEAQAVTKRSMRRDRIVTSTTMDAMCEEEVGEKKSKEISDQSGADDDSKNSGSPEKEEPEVREPKSGLESLLEQQSAKMTLMMQLMKDLHTRVEVAEEKGKGHVRLKRRLTIPAAGVAGLVQLLQRLEQDRAAAESGGHPPRKFTISITTTTARAQVVAPFRVLCAEKCRFFSLWFLPFSRVSTTVTPSSSIRTLSCLSDVPVAGLL
ncbi:hypothetical protein CYMTET_25844, partial [Cymbomonas tetramitiformis]